jgi:NAD-dependent deacetylase
MKKKLVVFSGAGISKESGIMTFRDANEGLWYNFKIEEVATPDGWKKNPEKVLQFYNERRSQLPSVEPNDAHKALVSLEEEYDVTVITQNVDDLHERAGSTNIIHLHGELTKARGPVYNHKQSQLDQVYDIGYKEISLGDKCSVNATQLRPHIVWFDEYPYGVTEAYQAISEADILLIIGTSLQIGYTTHMLNNVRRLDTPCEIYYIDPKPMLYLDNYGLKVNYIKKGGVEGVTELAKTLIIREIGSNKNDS